MSHVRHVRVTCSNWLPPLALMSILSILSRLRESWSNKIRVGCNVFWSSDWRGTVEMNWVVWWWWYETQETTISTDFSSSPPTVSINHNNKQSLVAALITTHLSNSCLSWLLSSWGEWSWAAIPNFLCLSVLHWLPKTQSVTSSKSQSRRKQRNEPRN